MKQETRFYNILFPVWLLLIYPVGWIFVIIGNFLIDTIVFQAVSYTHLWCLTTSAITIWVPATPISTDTRTIINMHGTTPTWTKPKKTITTEERASRTWDNHPRSGFFLR